MSFQTQLAVDMVTTFADTAYFGESVSYTPSGGSPVTRNAVIRRRVTPRDMNRGSVESPINTFEVWIANDATTGVASVKAGFDTVAFKKVLSDAANTTFRVTKILHQDPGAWHLEAQQ